MTSRALLADPTAAAAFAAIFAIALVVALDAARAFRRSSRRILFLALCVAAFGGVMALGARRPYDGKTRERAAREEIAATIDAIAKAAAKNDVDRVLERVSNDAPETRALLKENGKAVKLREAVVSELRIDSLDLDATPPRALVSFRATAKGTAIARPTPIRLPFLVESDFSDVELRREDDGVWRVQDRYTVKATSR